MVNRARFKYSQWLKGSIVVPPADLEPLGNADTSTQLLFRACCDGDPDEKQMAYLTQELGYLRKEAQTSNDKSRKTRN